MSKYHKIRWTESDNKELAKVVRNFNAKLNRIAKKNPQIKNVLPEKQSVRQLKELINTRQDLKRELNSLRRFSKRGSEEIVEIPNTYHNLKITKWQKTEMLKKVAIVNRRRKTRLKHIENIEIESRGEKLGYTRGDFGMGRIDKVDLAPTKAFTRSMGSYEVKLKYRSILEQVQSDYFRKTDYQLRENFTNTIKTNYRKEDSEPIVKAMMEMDIDKFLNIYLKDPNSFDWAYYPSEEEYQGYVNALKSTWCPEK